MRTVLSIRQKIWILLSWPFRKTYKANKCGHKTNKKGFIKYGDRTRVMIMPLEENGRPDYCLNCIGGMSIQCALCSQPIVIGSPIDFILSDTYEIPEYAISYMENGISALVVCLRWKCGFHPAGFWLPGDDGKGHVHRVPSPIEVLLSNPDASMMIVHNTHDIVEAENPVVISRN